ncbi:anti-sigma factor family protein [Corynebacterium ulcerans]|uniref:anti-sigma factor family protein n=1 Tax=Corynebacterium ulcerans TaxID=65058 RepID=UPI001748E936|nr:anti-sigma factor [Corynebacterium ulcerans]MBL4944062.1 anti-sigma factor [Corynebacterium ulcerans]QOE23968.1 anti-sigma factor [Corynebacterium ulcerans]
MNHEHRNSRVEKIRHFASVEHLNPEAVAALVDDELSSVAAHRAKIHLVHCKECRDEVDRQRRAADRLRGSTHSEMRASSDLLAKLQGIAHSCPAGPNAEDMVVTPQTFLDKIDGMARNIRKTSQNLRNARMAALKHLDEPNSR